MNTTDERLERYFHDRSTTIDLPHAGVDAITRRARRHRRRRSAAVGGLAATVLLVGAVATINQPAPDEEVGSRGAGVVDSPLDWSLVPVRTGLGGGSPAVSDGAAVYSLSTAPGVATEDTLDDPRRLYRSADGTDWEDVTLPEGLYASGVSAADGSVYAVGTAAAGGDVVGLELAVSSDGGEGWDSRAVPLDLDALGEGFPGRVRAVDAEVAVRDGATVVAVSVLGAVDPAVVLPDEDADLWWQREGGMTRSSETPCEVLPAGPGETTAPASTTSPPTTAPPTSVPPASDPSAVDAPPTTVPPASDPSAVDAPPVTASADPAGRDAASAACPDGDRQQETRSWADLGLTAEQGALADGRTYLFVAAPDGALEPVADVDGAGYADPGSARLLAADDGWWLFADEVGPAPSAGSDVTMDVTALHSTDGRTWTPSPVASDQSMLAAGVVGGRPVVLTVGSDPGAQSIDVQRIEPGGAVTTVDLYDLLGLPDTTGIFGYGVGPLGVVAVVGSSTGGTDTDMEVVSSLDGLQFSRQPIPDPEAGSRETVNGITITPDAIKVRLSMRRADDEGSGPPEAQRLFVGTP